MTSSLMDRTETMDVRELPLFAGLPAEELSTITTQVRRTTVPAGTILISAQLPGEAVYFILSGSVKVQLLRDTGGEIILALLGRGDFLGEMGPISGRSRSAYVITREETTLVWMERSVFLRTLDRAPALCRRLISELTERLRLANERFQALAWLDVTGRVARQILELAENYGRPVPGEGIRLDLPVTQGEIAEMIAATRERVNQVMVRLRRAGVFSVDAESRITVHLPDTLAELCRI